MGMGNGGMGGERGGMPQGSPLSPIVFLIWMAPILERIEQELRDRAGVGAGVGTANAVVDLELPSFVDDMCADIVIWEGCDDNMQRVEANVQRIVQEVAEENNLPLETEKEEFCTSGRIEKRGMRIGNTSSGWA